MMTSAERILLLTQLISGKLQEIFEDESAPSEFTMHELATGATLSVLSLAQALLIDEGSTDIITLEDAFKMIEDGIEEVRNHVEPNPN